MFWFRQGSGGQKQLEQAIKVLSQKGIKFTREGWSLIFSNPYTKNEIKELLSSQGITKYVVADITE